MSDDAPLSVGVVGVGNMGRHHARVLSRLPDVTLTGIADRDVDRAEAVAAEHDAERYRTEDLLDAVEAVSVVVPTAAHYDVARAAIDRGVHVLVEKPFVADVERGRELIDRADDAGVALQVGHVERFNPTVTTLSEVVADLDVVGVTSRRLGPPTDHHISDSVVTDLMIHDIDILLSLFGSDVTRVTGATVDGEYATALLELDGGAVATLMASRATERKVRDVSVSAAECAVTADYITRSVEIHRRSTPSYVETNGDVRYRHGSVVERPMVDDGEPLRRELSAFVEAARTGTAPPVTGADGLRAVELAHEIEARMDD